MHDKIIGLDLALHVRTIRRLCVRVVDKEGGVCLRRCVIIL